MYMQDCEVPNNLVKFDITTTAIKMTKGKK